MTSRVNGSLDRSGSIAVPEAPELEPAWRQHFLNVLQKPARFSGPQRFLRADISSAMRSAIHHDDSVLEAGVGSGALLASLPNEVRWGIDILPEAVEKAMDLDPTMRV